jgi:hypothetical protein
MPARDFPRRLLVENLVGLITGVQFDFFLVTPEEAPRQCHKKHCDQKEFSEETIQAQDS